MQSKFLTAAMTVTLLVTILVGCAIPTAPLPPSEAPSEPASNHEATLLTGSVLHGSVFDLVISIEAAGPVEWIYSPPPSEGGKVYIPFLFPDEEQCLLSLRMTPSRFVEGQKIYAGILVKTRDIDYTVAGISVSWSAAELTEPVKPADSERDVRVWETYEKSITSYPPSKVFFLQLPSNDMSVAPLLGKISTKAIQDSKYHAGAMDAKIYSSDPIAIDGLDQIFNEYLLFLFRLAN